MPRAPAAACPVEQILKGGHTVKRIPTRVGDVLIVETRQSFIIHAVAQVSEDGQQQCCADMKVKYAPNRAAAVAEARAAVAPGCRIFVRDLDTDNWFEISDTAQRDTSKLNHQPGRL